MRHTPRLLASLGIFAIAQFLPITARAQTEAETRRAAIEQFYPVMIEKLGKNDFEGARQLCQQAIKWEPTEPLHFYNLACIESRAGNINMALAALTKAADLGYANPESMLSDPDLEGVRDRGIFKEQYNRVEANALTAGEAAPATVPAPAPPPRPAAGNAPLPLAKEVQPAPHKVTNKGPVGLYIMSRYWIATGSLELSSWYFAPDGSAYENPAGGFSPEELAKTRVQAKVSGGGDTLKFTWSDGTSSTGNYEPNPAEKAFYWDMGNFVPVAGFADPSSVIGTWSGGTSVTGAAVAKTLTLNSDGTYTMEGAASISATSDGSTMTVGGSSANSGTWKAGQYSLTLNGSDGSLSRDIAFPFSVKGNDAQPEKFYYGGIMWSRQ